MGKYFGADTTMNAGQLAQAVGITPAHMSNLLRGKRRASTKVVRKIAKALGVSSDQIIQHIARAKRAQAQAQVQADAGADAADTGGRA